jgi:hypothetical protein
MESRIIGSTQGFPQHHEFVGEHYLFKVVQRRTGQQKSFEWLISLESPEQAAQPWHPR